MDKEMDCKCCREMTIEEELNSLPIDSDLKKELIEKIRLLRDRNTELTERLTEYIIEKDRMRATIVRLAMMISDK